MSSLTILDQIQIASPCEADWSKMDGDDRTRFCSSCSKHVYNIVAMTAQEATALILESEARLCLQIYRRRDGTILTADCPVGGQVFKARRFRRALALAVVLPALVVAGVVASGFGKRRDDPFPTGPSVTWDDRLDWALVRLGVRQPYSRYSKGGIGDVMYIHEDSPALSNSQAKVQREKMRAAGIQVPDEASSPFAQ